MSSKPTSDFAFGIALGMLGIAIVAAVVAVVAGGASWPILALVPLLLILGAVAYQQRRNGRSQHPDVV